MTAPGLSPAEQATVDRFDAAEAAPESWRPNRAARNATCCEHAARDHDTHGCAVNLSTHPRTYKRCHGLVTARPVGDGDGQDGCICGHPAGEHPPQRGRLRCEHLSPGGLVCACAGYTAALAADDRTGQR